MTKCYITLKFAQTLDGRIATIGGSSRWISSPDSRKFAHKLRANNDAVLVGVNTILIDNPSLTTRLVKGKNPIRVVLDTKLRVPLASKITKVNRNKRTIIITTQRAPKQKIAKLRKKGVEIVILPYLRRGNIDLSEIIRILYKKDIRRILVEGGAQIITSFLKKRLADRIVAIISPKILGSGINSVGELGIRNIEKALKVQFESIKHAGKDIICIAKVKA